MICPRCNVQTVVDSVEGARINVCSRCRGMFLRRGELNQIAEPTAGDLEFSTVEGESFRHEDDYGVTDCPACVDESMKKVEFNIHTNVILDYCDSCGGFWLDGAELDRINGEVRKLNDAETNGPDPPMLWFARFIWSLPR